MIGSQIAQPFLTALALNLGRSHDIKLAVSARCNDHGNSRNGGVVSFNVDMAAALLKIAAEIGQKTPVRIAVYNDAPETETMTSTVSGTLKKLGKEQGVDVHIVSVVSPAGPNRYKVLTYFDEGGIAESFVTLGAKPQEPARGRNPRVASPVKHPASKPTPRATRLAQLGSRAPA